MVDLKTELTVLAKDLAALSARALEYASLVDPPPPTPPPPTGLESYLPKTGVSRRVDAATWPKVKSALEAAEPGTLVVARKGVEFAEELRVTVSGTKDRPIWLAAEEPLTVKARDIVLDGSYQQVLGLEFANNSLRVGSDTREGRALRGSGARRCAWSGYDNDGQIQNILISQESYLEACEISRCKGRGFVVHPSSRGSRISRCHLHDFTGAVNGSEPIQVCFGAADHLTEIDLLLEWCLFERCNRGSKENESTSFKGSKIKARNLRYVDSRNLSSRFGNSHDVENVRMEGEGFVMIHGRGHRYVNVWAPFIRVAQGDWDPTKPGLPPILSGTKPSAYELLMVGCQGQVEVGYATGDAGKLVRARKIVIEAHRDGPGAVKNVQGGVAEWTYREGITQPERDVVAEPPMITAKDVGVRWGLAA